MPIETDIPSATDPDWSRDKKSAFEMFLPKKQVAK